MRLSIGVALVASVGGAPTRRVLVTTFGGSGASGVINALKSAGFVTNSVHNQDKLKFAALGPASRQLKPVGGQFCQKKHPDRCYDRVLVVVRDDPARAIVSTVFGTRYKEIRPSLARGCRGCPRQYPHGAPKDLLKNVFRHAGRAGQDGFGVASFLESWAKVAESHDLMSTATRYPPMLFVDVNMVASPDFQCFLYAYLEVRDLHTQLQLSALLEKPQPAKQRPGPHTLMEPPAKRVYEALAERTARVLDAAHEAAVKTFWNVTRSCRHRDLSSPLATDAPFPPERALRRKYRRPEGGKGFFAPPPRPHRHEIDPIDLIPDDLWDATLFAILKGE